MNIDYDNADISEDILEKRYPGILHALLKDNTRSPEDCSPEEQENIYWATDDYKEHGEAFEFGKPIKVELITHENGHVIMPRVSKQMETQIARSKVMAEVFTPSWVCNAQNNLVDNAWFGREGIFNTECVDENGAHTWKTNYDKIAFPEGKHWYDYIRDTRLEITCGEAPYIVSRYDTTTGKAIPLRDRIGILDRKLRVVSENITNRKKWIEWAKEALKSTYGFEWQGDNLLLARENILVTIMEYFEHLFKRPMRLDSLRSIANVISWNFWQMDGLTCGLPGQTPQEELNTFTFEDDILPRQRLCRVANWAIEGGSTKKEIVIFKALMNKQN